MSPEFTMMPCGLSNRRETLSSMSRTCLPIWVEVRSTWTTASISSSPCTDFPYGTCERHSRESPGSPSFFDVFMKSAAQVVPDLRSVRAGRSRCWRAGLVPLQVRSRPCVKLRRAPMQTLRGF